MEWLGIVLPKLLIFLIDEHDSYKKIQCRINYVYFHFDDIYALIVYHYVSKLAIRVRESHFDFLIYMEKELCDSDDSILSNYIYTWYEYESVVC